MAQYRPNGRMTYNNNRQCCGSNVSAGNRQMQNCAHDNSACKDSNKNMRNMPLGMCYVPMQEWDNLYSPCESLKQGTAFPDLNLIFCGIRGNM